MIGCTVIDISNLTVKNYNKRLNHITRKDHTDSVIRSYLSTPAIDFKLTSSQRTKLNDRLGTIRQQIKIKTKKLETATGKAKVKLEKSIQKYEKELKEKQLLVDDNKDFYGTKIRYIEVVVSITQQQSKINNMNYGDALYDATKEYLQKFGTIQTAVLHQDQESPHIHYIIDLGVDYKSKALERVTGVKDNQYEVIQKQFNEHMRNNEKLKIYTQIKKLNDDKINYLSIQEYKKAQKEYIDSINIIVHDGKHHIEPDINITKEPTKSFLSEDKYIFNKEEYDIIQFNYEKLEKTKEQLVQKDIINEKLQKEVDNILTNDPLRIKELEIELANNQGIIYENKTLKAENKKLKETIEVIQNNNKSLNNQLNALHSKGNKDETIHNQSRTI